MSRDENKQLRERLRQAALREWLELPESSRRAFLLAERLDRQEASIIRQGGPDYIEYPDSTV